MVRVLRVKAELDALEVSRVTWLDGVYGIEYSDPVALERLFAESDAELRRIKSGIAHLVLPRSIRTAEEAFEWLEAHLKSRTSTSTMPALGDHR